MAANTLMKILKNLLLLVALIILAHFTSSGSYSLYDSFFPGDSGGFFHVYADFAEYLIGMNLAYLFFLFLLFTAFGDQHKKWWMGIAAIPALAFLLYFDFSHIYFHLLFPIAGWLLGWGIAKLILMAQQRTV